MISSIYLGGTNKFSIYNFIGYKVKLYPTEEQKILFNNYFGVCRFIYNKCIDWQKEQYEMHKNDSSIKSRLQYFDFSARIIDLRCKLDWLNNFNLESLRYIARRAVEAFDRFFNNNFGFPKYKTKKDISNRNFPIRSDRLSIFESSVRIPSIGIVQSQYNRAEVIGSGDNRSKKYKYIKYTQTSVSFDGIDYYLTFLLPKSYPDVIESSYEKYHNNNYIHTNPTNIIGIDIGCSFDNWIVTSQGRRYCLPDSSKDLEKISKYKAKLANKMKYNKERTNLYRNQHKLQVKINKIYKKIRRRVIDKLYCNTHDILKNKPKAIVLEEITVKDMFKNRDNCDWTSKNIEKFNSQITQHIPWTVKRTITEVATNAGIPVFTVPKMYPSSKLCSCCGYKNTNLGSSKTFQCPVCGSIMGRDENAAANLSNYIVFIKPFTIYA